MSVSDLVCNMAWSEDGAVELLSHKRDDLVRTLQDIQPWIDVLRTWDALSRQHQRVRIVDIIIFLNPEISADYLPA